MAVDNLTTPGDDTSMTTETFTAEQITALQKTFVTRDEFNKVQRAFAGDVELNVPPMISRVSDMERRLTEQIGKLALKVDAIVTEREAEKNQLAGVTKLAKVFGFTSIGAVVGIVIMVANFVSKR